MEGRLANAAVKSLFQSIVQLQQCPHHHMAGNMEYKNSLEIRLGTWNIGTLNGKGLEICDELWKRNVDMCCLQEGRWRGCEA